MMERPSPPREGLPPIELDYAGLKPRSATLCPSDLLLGNNHHRSMTAEFAGQISDLVLGRGRCGDQSERGSPARKSNGWEGPASACRGWAAV